MEKRKIKKDKDTLKKDKKIYIKERHQRKTDRKTTKKTDKNVLYFDQLLGPECNQKLVKIIFWPFSTFLVPLRAKRGGR